LQESLTFNDYDYALVHLFEKHPEYFAFFRKSLTLKRQVILDNSLYELGESFEAESFAVYIEKLKPTYYIVPDVWADGPRNIDSYSKFDFDLSPLKIGVVQGKTLKEATDNYKFMKERADKIALTFGLPFYESLAGGSNKSERLMRGRIRFINSLKDADLWSSKPHHLLGCALPQEFAFYKNTPEIDTIDTSSPVVAGIHEILFREDGLKEKPEGKLIDFFQETLTPSQKSCIIYIIKAFKGFIL
jgi:hypothetical protein